MRRTVLLLRHAKAEGQAGAAADHERALAERGRRDARQMGGWLSAAGLAPDLLVSSSALRAQSTAELAAAGGKWSCPRQTTSALYEAAPEEIVELLRGLDAVVERPLLVGHEPAFSGLASLLVGGGRLRLATAAVAGIRLELPSWSQLAPGEGELVVLVAPKRV